MVIFDSGGLMMAIALVAVRVVIIQIKVQIIT